MLSVPRGLGNAKGASLYGKNVSIHHRYQTRWKVGEAMKSPPWGQTCMFRCFRAQWDELHFDDTSETQEEREQQVHRLNTCVQSVCDETDRVLAAQNHESKEFIRELMAFDVHHIPPNRPHKQHAHLIQHLMTHCTCIAWLWNAFAIDKHRKCHTWHDVALLDMIEFVELCTDYIVEYVYLCQQQDIASPQACVYHVPQVWSAIWSKITHVHLYRGMSIWNGGPLPQNMSPIQQDAQFFSASSDSGTIMWTIQGDQHAQDVRN